MLISVLTHQVILCKEKQSGVDATDSRLERQARPASSDEDLYLYLQLPPTEQTEKRALLFVMRGAQRSLTAAPFLGSNADLIVMRV